MKTLLLTLIALFIFAGCSVGNKNLSFQEENKLRVTFNCIVPFDDVRKVRTYEDKNIVKEVYYVEFNNIYESYFELTHKQIPNMNISLNDYVDFLTDEGIEIQSQKKVDSILYISFNKREKQFNQIISTSWNSLKIANAEPLMFEAIKTHCSK